MALIQCYECSKQISDKAISCPNCGAPTNLDSNKNHGLRKEESQLEKNIKEEKEKVISNAFIEQESKNNKISYKDNKLFHTNSKTSVFLEDYAYAIAMLLDLSDQTLKPNYLFKARDLCKKTIDLFYVKEKSIFQKNIITDNDLFHEPIDISDNNIPNGNSIMLLNFSRLGMKNEAKELSNSLNCYLNIYKTLMISSLKAIDFHKLIESSKNCNETGCII